MTDHISRKELKQDKIKETFEHGAEAVLSHGQITIIVLLVVLAAVAGWGGWNLYQDRQTVQASALLETAMKAYSGHVDGTPGASDPNEPNYPNEAARSQDALQKFSEVANKYPHTNPGKMARYYSALCLEDLEKENQALEELKKISGGSDKELSALAQFQMAVSYSRTGKPEEAIKIYRALADKPTVLVPRPMVLLELARVLRQTNPQEAIATYQQIKKEYADDTTIAEEADRGLETLSPKS